MLKYWAKKYKFVIRICNNILLYKGIAFKLINVGYDHNNNIVNTLHIEIVLYNFQIINFIRKSSEWLYNYIKSQL